MQPPFKLYRSSAGSGKTYTLAKEYLKLALTSPGNKAFMQILAVTFTNKATAEMKDRIIGYLKSFSTGQKDHMYRDLQRFVDLNDEAFESRCQRILSNILHQYAHFSVSTIDAFFQKVIRAFAKEVGLFGGFTLEIDQSKVLRHVIDDLLDEIGENKTLTQWLLKFSEEKVDEGKSWDIRTDIRALGSEVFKEEFKHVEADIVAISNSPKQLNQSVKEFQSIVSKFKNHLGEIGEQGLTAIKKANLAIEDFAYGKAGVANYFNRLTSGNDFEPKKRVRDATDNIEAWFSKSSTKKDQISQVVDSSLILLLNEAVTHYDKHVELYESAKQILKNLYTFGIITDITRKLSEYKRTNDVMLISDAAYFLQEIIKDNDSPFIYEKVGSFYRYFLIDEFQDTSSFQWQNFKPLIENSLAEGNQNMLVGDVKQSIYRWRGGDWRLLLEGVEKEIHPEYINKLYLTQNFRSEPKIIQFNNQVFTRSADVLTDNLISQFHGLDDDKLKDLLIAEANKLKIAYQDVYQTPGKGDPERQSGFIKFKFLSEEPDNEEKVAWKSQAMNEIPPLIEELQDNGISLKDAVILVRNGKEGREIANYLLDYQKSELAKPDYNYDVISNEALYLNAAPSIQFLINVIKFLANPRDQVAKVSVIYEYHRYILNDEIVEAADLFYQPEEDELINWLPERFVKARSALGKLPLYEKLEQLIDIFNLNKLQGEWVYIQSLQNAVLNFTSTEKGDVNSFLSWWEENAGKLTIQLAEDVNALKIMTVHKSKGLQFKVVIIPFLSWELDVDSRKNNIIWAKSTVAPFASLGHFPLRYSSDLAKTIYRDYYYKEKIKSYLDNLNLLYVAFTRAEESLICFGQLPKYTKNRQVKVANNVGNLVYHVTNDPNQFDTQHWIDENTYIEGSMSGLKPSKIDNSEAATIALNDYVSNSWRSKLAIKPKATDFFKADEHAKQAKINYGLLIHDLMARIKHKDQLGNALEELVKEGVVNNHQKKQLKVKMESLFSHQMINDWFSDTNSWEVKTEVPILPKTGELSRLDRVLTKDEKAIIIDFKTGSRKQSDQQRVMQYADLMAEMGFKHIKAYLLYIEDEFIEEVI